MFGQDGDTSGDDGSGQHMAPDQPLDAAAAGLGSDDGSAQAQPPDPSPPVDLSPPQDSAPTDTPSPMPETGAGNFIMTDPAAAPTPDDDIVVTDEPHESEPDSAFAVPVTVNSTPVTSTTPVAPDDLAAIKQQALQQLSPLVQHLDQTPEEKFRTTMMMLQATDDQNLISVAYDAAQGIADDKTRARALLDVINEINYFTQKTEPAA